MGITLDFLKGIRTEKGIPCGPKNDNLIIFEASDCSDETLRSAPIWGSMCGYAPKRIAHKFNSRGLCVVFIADGDRRKNRGAIFNAYLHSVSDEEANLINRFNQPGN